MSCERGCCLLSEAGEERQETTREILQRATTLAAEGGGSSVLRRHARTIDKWRTKRKETSAKLSVFRREHSKARRAAPPTRRPSACRTCHVPPVTWMTVPLPSLAPSLS